MKLKLQAIFVATLVSMLSVFSGFAAADSKKMHEISLNELIVKTSELTNKNFVIDQRIKGNITLIVDFEALNNNELLELLHQSLLTNNYGLIERDGYFMVVPTNQLRNLTHKVDITGNAQGSDFITAVIKLKHVNSSDAIAILRPVIAKYGHIAPVNVNGQHSIVIVDHAENIKRFRKLVEGIDVAK